MSAGRYIMRGRVFQGRAFAPWALAGAAGMKIGRVAASQIYASHARQSQMYQSGAASGQSYQSGTQSGAVE